MEIFNGQGERFDGSAQRSASNKCIRLIRKLRWIGMDDEAERVLAQLSGWPFRPTETVIAGPGRTSVAIAQELATCRRMIQRSASPDSTELGT